MTIQCTHVRLEIVIEADDYLILCCGYAIVSLSLCLTFMHELAITCLSICLSGLLVCLSICLSMVVDFKHDHYVVQ